MFHPTDDVIRAEIAYRQAKIAEQYRRANGRRRRRTAAPKHSARRAA
ncbi:MAG TPA: hypothetical protein VEK80_04355 [Kribbellaceae bacterium]|nr:hypothetical protein [Kribbellaceae bacterium]